MKKLLLLMVLFLIVKFTFAQVFDPNSVHSMRTIVQYTMAAKGIYHKYEKSPVDLMEKVNEYYAFNKKTNELYVLTKRRF